MLRQKHLLLTSVVCICTFIIIIIYSAHVLNKLDVKEVSKVKIISEKYNEIEVDISNLSYEYKKRQDKEDTVSKTFLENIVPTKDKFTEDELKRLWFTANKWVTDKQIFNSNDSVLGNVAKALQTAKILFADVDSRGTQLKILIGLEGKQKAVFKPQWYDKEQIIVGDVYAGNDRYGAEILGFYLAGILDLRFTPVASERILNLKDEIIPVATTGLKNTIFEQNNKTCVYGKCFYCKKEKPVCETSPGKLHGAIIFHIPGKLTNYRSPWQRTYRKGKKAVWEVQDNYCEYVKSQLSNKRLLDLVDTAIFDFLIQNGDRHHYETLHDKVILLDNGKGLGNSYVHHLDILAPLYQCCSIRKTTFERLKKLSGGLLKELLNSIPEVISVVTHNHIKSIDKRLLFIFAFIEKCKKQNKLLYY